MSLNIRTRATAAPAPSGTGTLAFPLSAGLANDPATWSDEALMLAVMATRDAACFELIYDRYADLVFSVAMRVLGDEQLAEDAAQDVFIRLWRRPEGFVPERGRFLSWIVSVARNRAVDELRSRGRRLRREGIPIEEPEALFIDPSDGQDPQIQAEHSEEARIVRAALCRLPCEQQLALELAYFGGLTQQEVATVLNQPLGTVKTRIRLGMQKLRRTLETRI